MSAWKKLNHGFHGWARMNFSFFPCLSVKSVVKLFYFPISSRFLTTWLPSLSAEKSGL